ncbi:MAG TPA: thiamine pyrophosphate-binding protein [Pirellulaceae bacterium]|jgi:benzoylformate decarboxylase|nr:thiamine pyrophosphate-binding protein [Pirellulaceae bacterium]
MNGIQAFLELLAGCGVKYLFGNPGTTELPLNDALVTDQRFQYILGLQEVPVMGMADGYAMASGQLGVVNLHISCGLGNAMGMLYNAYREGTPLLVTAGQQDRRLMFEEPILWGEMVNVVRPWTKWAYEVSRVEDLPQAVRRAVQAALTPPTGPVFLSLPVDVQMQACGNLDLSPMKLPDSRVRPPIEAIRHAAEILVAAKNPAILAGSRVTERDAIGELVQVAERLGAPVITESGTTHGRLALPSDHPLNAQGLPLWSPEVRERLKEYDVLLVVGMDLLRQYVYYEPSCAIPENIKLVHIDEESWQIGKNYPVEVGVIGETKASLSELLLELDDQISDKQRLEIGRRRNAHATGHTEARKQLQKRIDEELSIRPLTPLGLMGALAKILPPDVAVIEEAVTTTNTTFERLGALKNTTGYFGHRGWALGWGLGVSIGVKLAWPDRPVLALLGEGASLYGIQGLWSAARYKIPVVFVICNNAQYQILKIGARGLQLPQAIAGKYEGMDLVEPEVDLVAMARGLGVEARRISDSEELCAAVTAAWKANDKPVLFDVPISRAPQSRLNYG